MNKRTYIILGSVLAICIISIYIVVCIFTHNGYCIAWQTPIDYEGTATFVSILSLIIIPTITLVSVLVYYATLSEQREQNRLLQSQHFMEQWQHLVAQQIAIRDNTMLTLPVLHAASPDRQTFAGVHCFKKIWMIYIRLVEAIKSKHNYSDWERTEAEYEGHYIDPTGELACMEHYEPEKYAKLRQTDYEKLQVAYVGYRFDIRGDYPSGISPTNEAFRLVYERYFRLSSTYYSHLCSMLLYMQRKEQQNELSGEQIGDCITILTNSLCRAELLLIKQYAEYDTKNKELIQNYLFQTPIVL